MPLFFYFPLFSPSFCIGNTKYCKNLLTQSKQTAKHGHSASKTTKDINAKYTQTL